VREKIIGERKLATDRVQFKIHIEEQRVIGSYGGAFAERTRRMNLAGSGFWDRRLSLCKTPCAETFFGETETFPAVGGLFHFYSNVNVANGTNRTNRAGLMMSVDRDSAEVALRGRQDRF
jgi:hypothetical protein